ncbi:IS110 family transposase [Nonomuraea fuscirosea]|uniref:IS110 family transposase n=1 Tax=Nonomuraea fuscirosea TaxID=1291556 RepID=UPI003F4CCFEF
MRAALPLGQDDRTTMTSITPDNTPVSEVAGGVDTHQDTHTAAVIDPVGRVLGTEQFPATPAGYAALLAWMCTFGQPIRVGEGTGAYGAGLTRLLQAERIAVIEIDRPYRKARRFQGKSDPIDAIAAAKAALAGDRTGTPKQRDGRIEALRTLRIARRSAVDQRADTQRQIKTLIVTAPDTLRLRGLTSTKLIATCAALTPRPRPCRRPAHRHPDRAALPGPAPPAADRRDRRPRRTSAHPGHSDQPRLSAAHGVGTDTAGQLLVTAGENHDRIPSEAAFAMLCGFAPIPASSAKTTRHRLNRGGDRQANAALYRVVLCRLRWGPPHPRLHGTRHPRRPDQERDHPLRRPLTQRAHHHDGRPRTSRLTSIGASSCRSPCVRAALRGRRR